MNGQNESSGRSYFLAREGFESESEYATSTYRPKLEVKKLGEEADAPTVILGTSIATTSTYTYNAIGNLLTKSDLGSFTYGETGLANPHAATVINGVGLSYDNNGNVTGYGTAGYAWDYRNRMSSAGNGTATSTYAYDHSIARVSKTVGGMTTRYPSNLYEHSSATTTKHLYLGDILVASVNGTGTTTASTTWAYQDHLNSTRVVADEDGDPIQSLSYTPFGAQESNVASTSIQQSNRYIGENYDPESALSYLNARYYDGAKGQFLSQDPVFLGIGVDSRTDSFLRNPQIQNSYSYAMNNPITYKDSTGEEPLTVSTILGTSLLLSWASITSFGLQQRIGEYEIETMKAYPTIYTEQEIAEVQAKLDNSKTAGAISQVVGALSKRIGIVLDAGDMLIDYGTEVLDIKLPEVNIWENNEENNHSGTETNPSSNQPAPSDNSQPHPNEQNADSRQNSNRNR